MKRTSRASTLTILTSNIKRLLAKFRTTYQTYRNLATTTRCRILRNIMTTQLVVTHMRVGQTTSATRFFPNISLTTRGPYRLLNIRLVRQIIQIRSGYRTISNSRLFNHEAFRLTGNLRYRPFTILSQTQEHHRVNTKVIRNRRTNTKTINNSISSRQLPLNHLTRRPLFISIIPKFTTRLRRTLLFRRTLNRYQPRHHPCNIKPLSARRRTINN